MVSPALAWLLGFGAVLLCASAGCHGPIMTLIPTAWFPSLVNLCGLGWVEYPTPTGLVAFLHGGEDPILRNDDCHENLALTRFDVCDRCHTQPWEWRDTGVPFGEVGGSGGRARVYVCVCVSECVCVRVSNP